MKRLIKLFLLLILSLSTSLTLLTSPASAVDPATYCVLTAAASDKIVVFDGNGLYIFDTKNLTWSLESSPRLWGYMGSVTSLGNKIFFSGAPVFNEGFFTNQVEIYDLITNTWSSAAMSSARLNHASVSVGEKLLFAGGEEGAWGNYLDSVEIYDGRIDKWSTAYLSEPRANPAAAATHGIAIIAGGVNGGDTSAADIYNSETDAWSKASLSLARRGIAASAAGTKIVFAGGIYHTATISDRVDIYDTVTQVWSTASLSVPRFDMAAAAIGNKLLFVAGRETDGQSDVVDIYDTENERWTTSKLPARRGAGPGIKLRGASAGDYAIFCGADASDSSYSPIDYYYFPDDAWLTSPDLCPQDKSKTAPGVCGCGVLDYDSDGDNSLDCNDACPADAAKTAPGFCGCGASDSDSDGDSTPDCTDDCPRSDIDSDKDGTPDCRDGCPNDPKKTAPAICGCAIEDRDSNVDGMMDCFQIGVSVNGGAAYTNDSHVTLTLVYPADTRQIIIANDGGFMNGASFAPSSTLSWKLPETGLERLPKTVYVKFIGIGGVTNGTYTDDVILDQSPPKVEAFAASIFRTNCSLIKVSIKAHDTISPVTSMRFSTRSVWTPYKKHSYLSIRNRRMKSIRVRVKDAAGNASRWKTSILR